MRNILPMKIAKTGYGLIAAALIVLGILLMVNPVYSAAVIGRAAGILMIVFGAVRLVGYCSKDLFRLAFQYDLAFGMLMIALGVIVLLKPNDAMAFVCVALGICILADGLFKVQIAADARSFGVPLWWLILALAILAGAIGLVLVFRPTESSSVLVVLLGASLLAEGILNLITILTSVKIVRHQRPDNYDRERKD